jgi:hypothetical protein
VTTLKLAQILPVRVLDNGNQATWGIPSSSVVMNIPALWEILNQIVQDWRSVASEYRLPASVNSDDHAMTFAMDAIERTKPRFIQCLFSYITFFFMLENGYHSVYSELNQLNRELGLKLQHDKPPKRTEFVNRLWRIRNVSIAHWADAGDKDSVDSIAGRGWGLSFSASGADARSWNLEELQTLVSRFRRHDKGTGATEISANLRTKPIPQMHSLCSSYLGQFDSVCASYLGDIKSRLPMAVGDRRYDAPG